MQKLSLMILLFLCIISPLSSAFAENINLCGTYFEDNDRSFIRIARQDLFNGSNNCDIEAYQERVMQSGYVNLALNHTRNRPVPTSWNKFNDHVIEVRGKIRKGMITNTKLIRDAGV